MKNRKVVLPAACVLLMVACVPVALMFPREDDLYGHVVLGRDAGLRLQFIVRGPEIYLDRNRDDRPQESELVGRADLESSMVLTDRAGVTTYTLSGGLLYPLVVVRSGTPQQLYFNVTISGSAQYRQVGGPVLTASARDPGVAHFDGPLKFLLRKQEVQLVRGGQPIEVRIELGTREAGKGSAVVCSNKEDDYWTYAFDAGIVPELEVDFPAADPDAGSIRKRFALDQFC